MLVMACGEHPKQPCARAQSAIRITTEKEMHMDKTQKLFAFKLAGQEDAKKAQNADTDAGKWQTRDGVAVAGCTDPTRQGDYRYGTRWSSDNGVWC
jgi:hypothetical protein